MRPESVVSGWQEPDQLHKPKALATATYLPEDHLRLRLRFAKPRYQLGAAATYLPEDYLRLRLRFAKPRYQLIATATYLHSVTVQRLGCQWTGGSLQSEQRNSHGRTASAGE